MFSTSTDDCMNRPISACCITCHKSKVDMGLSGKVLDIGAYESSLQNLQVNVVPLSTLWCLLVIPLSALPAKQITEQVIAMKSLCNTE